MLYFSPMKAEQPPVPGTDDHEEPKGDGLANVGELLDVSTKDAQDEVVDEWVDEDDEVEQDDEELDDEDEEDDDELQDGGDSKSSIVPKKGSGGSSAPAMLEVPQNDGEKEIVPLTAPELPDKPPITDPQPTRSIINEVTAPPTQSRFPKRGRLFWYGTLLVGAFMLTGAGVTIINNSRSPNNPEPTPTIPLPDGSRISVSSQEVANSAPPAPQAPVEIFNRYAMPEILQNLEFWTPNGNRKITNESWMFCQEWLPQFEEVANALGVNDKFKDQGPHFGTRILLAATMINRECQLDKPHDIHKDHTVGLFGLDATVATNIGVGDWKSSNDAKHAASAFLLMFVEGYNRLDTIDASPEKKIEMALFPLVGWPETVKGQPNYAHNKYISAVTTIAGLVDDTVENYLEDVS